MNKKNTGLIVLLIVAALGMSVFLIGSIAGGGEIYTGVKTVELVNTQEIEMSNFKDIEILYDDSSMDIDFYENDTDTMIIKEYMYQGSAKKHLAVITSDEKSGRVTVESGLREFGRNVIMVFGIMSGRERVEVYLPKGYQGSIQARASSGDITSDFNLELTGQLTLRASSGDINMPSVSAEKIQMKTSSGEIRVEHAEGTRTFTSSSGDIRVLGGKGDSSFTASSGSINVQQIEGSFQASCNSGDITLEDVIGDGELQTSSGSIRCQNVTGTMNKVKSSSGDIKITDFTGAINAQSSSGEITVGFTKVTGDVKAQASSGDIRLTIPESTVFTFEANTSSGDITTWFDDDLNYNKRGNRASGVIGSDSGYQVQLETASGSIRVTD